MDVAAELWEWGKTAVVGLLGLLAWYFRRSHERIEKRLDDHDEDLSERLMVSDFERHRIESDQRFRVLETDIKNLGEKFSVTLQSQLIELRRDVFGAIAEQNKRLDQLLLVMTKRNGSNE